jgi:hypothetical protein
MARYKVNSPWRIEDEYGFGVETQSADIVDIRTGDEYSDSAWRVLVDDKPHRGKGGTHPYFGESAWSNAQRLARDIALDRRYS